MRKLSVFLSLLKRKGWKISCYVSILLKEENTSENMVV